MRAKCFKNTLNWKVNHISEHVSNVLFLIWVSKIFTYKMSRVILGGWEPVIRYVLDAFLHDASSM